MSETDAASTPKKGWELLHSKLPQQALKPISKDVYGVDGLTDVNEGYLITRLFASGLTWSWEITRQEYLGSEERKTRGQNSYTYTVYLASVQGRLRIGDQTFDGSGAHDNRKLDAAFKGAATVAFKNAAKMAGLFAQLLMDGRAIDFIYTRRDDDLPAETSVNPPAGGTNDASGPSSTSGTSSTSTPASSSSSSSAQTAAPASSSKPKPELTKRQNAALGYLVKWTKPEPAGELPAEMNAKVRAYEKGVAHLVANPDDQPGAFEAMALELIDMHTIACGPDCAHAKAVKGQLAVLKADVEQQQQAA